MPFSKNRSAPLPNDIDDNPFNALCCHGVSSSKVMTRLILVLDEASGLPVWYDIIPGNILDIKTVMTIVDDVADNNKLTELDAWLYFLGSDSPWDILHITEKYPLFRQLTRKSFIFAITQRS